MKLSRGLNSSPALAKIPKFLEHPAALSMIKNVTNRVLASRLSILKTTGAVEPAEDQSDALAQGKSMATGLKTRWLQVTNQSLFDAMNMTLRYDDAGKYHQENWENFVDLVEDGKVIKLRWMRRIFKVRSKEHFGRP